MKKETIALIIYMAICSILIVLHNEGCKDKVIKEVQQSKEHHERFHNLIIDSVKTHSIIDRMNYDIGCDLKSVTINCDKN